ncbi:kinase-like protein [Hesseltinella vesiculosa]|uniref:Kinase-like protein n=1 Tax=Hesseltinella vesiculosa TaxID=101127 RepID=A0A1X2G4P8_9FUNG|nr:kinase-like protein [Hesseltinella vesiculosa]
MSVDTVKPQRPKLARPKSGNFKVATCETVLDLVLCHELFPEWIPHKDDMTLDRVNGALTNAIFFVNYKTSRKLLRVYGVGADDFIDREKELMWLERLGRLNLGPRLLAIFGNGRFEEYVPSLTLHHDDLRVPETSRQIAVSLSRQHSLISIYPTPDTETLEIWKIIEKWYHMLPSVLPLVKARYPSSEATLNAFDFDRLGREISACKAFLTHHIKSPVIFGHNDLQYGNILKREGTGALVLVDFEYSGYNPRGYDIANHFMEWRYDYHGVHPALFACEFPTHDEQRNFLQAYIGSMKDLDLYDGTSLDDLQKEVLAFVMTTHCCWGIWGLIQASQSEIDFDYFAYSMERLACFRQEYAKWDVEVATLST